MTIGILIGLLLFGLILFFANTGKTPPEIIARTIGLAFILGTVGGLTGVFVS